MFERLLQRFINVFLKIFIYCPIFPLYTRYQLIHQYKLLFWDRVNDLMRILTAIQKVRNDHIMRIIILLVMNKPLEKSKLIIIYVEIYRSQLTQRSYK